MKKTFFSLSILSILLGACASPLKDYNEDFGWTCVHPEREEGEQNCVRVKAYRDPTQWHYVRDWEKNRLPSRPDLP